MALPFLAITLYPAVAAKLPKPGVWMVKVKFAMGVALAATAAWLISVLAVQLTVPAAVIVGALMMALGITLVCRRYLAQRWHMSATAAILAMAVFVLIAGRGGLHADTPDQMAAQAPLVSLTAAQ